MEKGEMEEIKRHFGVVAEGLRSEIRQVAEGVANVDEMLDREIGALRDDFRAFREDNDRAHREILSAIKFSYAELDQRLVTVEGEVVSLKSRVERLERGK